MHDINMVYKDSKAQIDYIIITPAYYIFNNNELEQILKIKPKSIQELRENKILSDIKLKLYGEDIVNLIK